MMSTDSSVEPPSQMMYSRLGYPWSRTDRIVCSRYRPWLKLGVTMEMRGSDIGQRPSLPGPLSVGRAGGRRLVRAVLAFQHDRTDRPPPLARPACNWPNAQALRDE